MVFGAYGIDLLTPNGINIERGFAYIGIKCPVPMGDVAFGKLSYFQS